MNKPLSLIARATILVAIAAAGIIYIFNRSPVEDLGSYDKQEMVKPNRSKSLIDNIFPGKSNKRSSAEDDDVSLMGASGRYDEVRIGKEKE
ncbi:hypothetical protein MNBD_GAMMA11-1943 [hydrothermal vent metagenome]|uniref:Uncharacterized protein n=1 Tax=hydrothermal vent metagenome TaxID=652676 RepID=A0A3B0X5M0_9ZZZZ